ncbi:hypothetical protein AB0L70_41550, partial [Kribbella sp. NPDC051952]
ICRRHHTALHAGHWTITITNGKVHVTRPTWANPPPHLQLLPPTPPHQSPPHTEDQAERAADDPSPAQPSPAQLSPAQPGSPHPSPLQPRPVTCSGGVLGRAGDLACWHCPEPPLG